ncbi:LAQU0S11e01288g1_1 [Lachancea quebecensis]|uniref:Geranylgeranyl transferase type-2 subunit alpha n=1 Tax=Lachancea quebecensis TaxID=1654605 RepID=A0A0P1KWF3_9SACH|nr:LAQU0S11e01288g1_1 [Lachancea quebecensis]
MHGVKRREWTQELVRQKRLRDVEKIVAYKTLTNDVLSAKKDGVFTHQKLDTTRKLLELNPEFNAVWNYRRDLISALKSELSLEFWNNELAFTMQQLKLFPKVYWIWNHRLWCLNHFPQSPIGKWQQELAIVSKLLTMDARNFHGWHYRRVVVGRLEQMLHTSLNQQELDFTTEKINANISNFSAWHQRANLLPKMFEKGQVSNEKSFVEHEFRYIINAMFTDAEDQSVWFYIKWFVKSDIVTKSLSPGEYASLLQDLKDNITLINEDELEFSGKENMWCLKILCVLEELQMKDVGRVETQQRKILDKLTKIDPLRQNRYLHLAQDSKENVD